MQHIPASTNLLTKGQITNDLAFSVSPAPHPCYNAHHKHTKLIPQPTGANP